MTPELIFNAANLFVLPFWAIMILLPNWGITRKVMNSFIPFAVLAALYIYLFGSSLTAENAAALSNPKLADIAKFLGEETAAATGMDTFFSDGLVCRALDLFGRTADRSLDGSFFGFVFLCWTDGIAFSYCNCLDYSKVFPEF
jgi:hypothetical protein